MHKRPVSTGTKAAMVTYGPEFQRSVSSEEVSVLFEPATSCVTKDH